MPITPTIARRGDEGELFRCHHDQLVRAVWRVVTASPALIEDACQNAWAILLRRQHDREDPPAGQQAAWTGLGASATELRR